MSDVRFTASIPSLIYLGNVRVNTQQQGALIAFPNTTPQTGTGIGWFFSSLRKIVVSPQTMQASWEIKWKNLSASSKPLLVVVQNDWTGGTVATHNVSLPPGATTTWKVSLEIANTTGVRWGTIQAGSGVATAGGFLNLFG